jgi:hypothetical protein
VRVCVLNIPTPGGICLYYGELFLATRFYCMLSSVGALSCSYSFAFRHMPFGSFKTLKKNPLECWMEWIRCFSLCHRLL